MKYSVESDSNVMAKTRGIRHLPEAIPSNLSWPLPTLDDSKWVYPLPVVI
ncbi:MAG: hypothetical protein PHW40_08190 [Candidatus Izemoplasmatales bacterium]|nr:hypothetical protein [Candidatus Izemoplasmatales bacterium]